MVDGDTVDVEITRIARVRLKDCWAPDGPNGRDATNYLKEKAEGKEAILFIPQKGEDLQDLWSFGRALGYVWLESEDETINEVMVRLGYARDHK